MSVSVLSQVTLCYQPVWNQWRKCSGVRLLVDTNTNARVNAEHLLQAVSQLWPKSNDRILLSVKSPALLSDLLQHSASHGVGIEIQDHWLSDHLLTTRIRDAKTSGIRLIWRGTAGQTPSADVQDWFHNTLRSLTPQEALRALRTSVKNRKNTLHHAPRLHSPVLANHLYEGLASPALVTHALDTQGAAGVVGWPTEEVLYGYHFKPIQPSRHLLMELIKAIEIDEPVETLEHYMYNDPLLAYRFMRYVNSASVGLQRSVLGLRDGLISVGYAQLRAWAAEQLPRTSTDPNLDPIRFNMVLRARIMEKLVDESKDENLRREVFLCGLFSQLDLLLNEPLESILKQLPVSEPVRAAMMDTAGPYAVWMEIASALEDGSTRMIAAVCESCGVAPEDVNRALLQALATLSNAN